MSQRVSKDPDRVRRMFDRVAGQYDFLNRLLSLGLDRVWRRHLVERLPQGPVLDLACGSGDVLLQLHRSGLGAGATGVDFSGVMLEKAQEKFREHEIGASLVQGDAGCLPLAPKTFSGVTCAFGVRNFQDRPRAFKDVYRILNDAGVFAILEFFPPSNSLLRLPIRWYLGTVLPVLGNLFSSSDGAYDYLRRSIDNFVSAETLGNELRDSGFERVSIDNEFMGLVKIITAHKKESVPHA